MIYAQWDPMFLIVPLWLRVLCSIEVFLFGPLYLAVAVGMVKDADWLFPLSLVLTGLSSIRPSCILLWNISSSCQARIL